MITALFSILLSITTKITIDKKNSQTTFFFFIILEGQYFSAVRLVFVDLSPSLSYVRDVSSLRKLLFLLLQNK